MIWKMQLYCLWRDKISWRIYTVSPVVQVSSPTVRLTIAARGSSTQMMVKTTSASCSDTKTTGSSIWSRGVIATTITSTIHMLVGSRAYRLRCVLHNQALSNKIQYIIATTPRVLTCFIYIQCLQTVSRPGWVLFVLYSFILDIWIIIKDINSEV